MTSCAGGVADAAVPPVDAAPVGAQQAARNLRQLRRLQAQDRFELRDNARPLEVSGLGYVNLLHIAVTLAAIPDPAIQASAAGAAARDSDAEGMVHQPERSTANGSAADGQPDGPGNPREAAAALAQARAEAESQEDSFFPAAPFHATVVIEEPEAHLHPQLQHSLVRYLRRVVATRPEIQVLRSSHATDVITSCHP
jgi:putative ATP-dependent endonuclease of OLD family